jgi:AcrR family transcriptional regulator
VATLFRRFPTREELIAATFADPMTEHAALIETALADPDSWHGFCGYVRAVCSMQPAAAGSPMCSPSRSPPPRSSRLSVTTRFARPPNSSPARKARARSAATSSPKTSRCCSWPTRRRSRHRRRRTRDLTPTGGVPHPGLFRLPSRPTPGSADPTPHVPRPEPSARQEPPRPMTRVIRSSALSVADWRRYDACSERAVAARADPLASWPAAGSLRLTPQVLRASAAVPRLCVRPRACALREEWPVSGGSRGPTRRRTRRGVPRCPRRPAHTSPA